MAKVSLRIYNREIETLVDRGELDEAIAHCRHILNTFPKNLETYRLLGKAYLEARRYTEATEIFQRVLMAVPNDFVSHVGMSIIRDEQGDMDAAIWHMERAFEVQPSNAAIQAELQRLFGRRDGVEPPKIRLNRGALAHMYIQGELYPQAIAEIKAVLEDDRDRQDMQVLLARAYFHSGQKNEAAEVCAQLLRRYPYCLDANRVLIELLPESERGESPQVYRNRVNELDPYARFTTGSVFHTNEVSDAAVSLDRLEWDGQSVNMKPDWQESLGISLDDTSAEEEEPDWLKAGLSPLSASLSDQEPASVSGSDDEIPDFLREAGWGKDSGTFKEGPSTFEASGESTEEAELAEADLPDWIKAMAPSEADLSTSAPLNEMEDDLTQDDVPDWLQGLGSAQDSSEGQPLEKGELPDWLADMKAENTASQEPEMEAEPPAISSSEEDLPDWLADMKPETSTSVEAQPPEETQPELAAEEEGLPNWLAAMKAEEATSQEPEMEAEPPAIASSEDELPDWLAEMKPETSPSMETQPPEETRPEPAAEEEGLPDWLAEMESETVISGNEQPELTSEEDLPDWLADMKPETPPSMETQPPKETQPEPAAEEEGLPDWLAEMKSEEVFMQESQPAEETMAEPAAEGDLPDWLADMKPDETAKPEEQPDETILAGPAAAEELPDWVAALKAEAEVPQEEQVQEEQVIEEAPATLTSDEDLPDWLRAIQAEEDQLVASQAVEETAQEPVQELPEMSSESLSDWQISEDETVGAVDFDATDTGVLGTTASEQDDAIAWLEGLAAKHGAKPEELVTDPEERTEIEPEWVQQAKAVKDQEAPETTVPLQEPAAETSEELPEFLAEDQADLTEVSEFQETQIEASASVPSAEEQDDAIAWLESLAAKHGAKAEELVTDPDARKETAPDWVQKAAEAASAAQPPEEAVAPVESIESELPEAEPVGEEAGSPASELEDTKPHKPVRPAEMDETGLWLQELTEKEGATVEQEPAAETPISAMEMDENIPDWLREVPSETAKAETELPAQEETQEATAWMNEADVEPAEASPTSPAEQEEEGVPDWLSEMEAGASEPEASVASEEKSQEVPDWLLETEEEQVVEEKLPATPSEGETAFEPEEVVGKIDINSATLGELASLPGIGEGLARDIMAFREAYGAFSSIEELSNIGGIGLSTIDELRGRVEFRPVESDFTDWLRSVEQEETGAEALEITTEGTESDDLPAWLAGLDEQTQPETAVSKDEDLPDWLRGVDEQEPAPVEPTTPGDWRPTEAETPPQEELQEQPETEPEPLMEEPHGEAAPERPSEPEAVLPPEEPVTSDRSGMTGMLSSAQDPVLAQAQLELGRGNVNGALDNYERLIKKGRMLDEIIFDLREAQYQYPVDVSIMQTLGDAYMRANRLQDALDAYTKAEELLR